MLTLALETFRLSPVIHEAAEKPKNYFFHCIKRDQAKGVHVLTHEAPNRKRVN